MSIRIVFMQLGRQDVEDNYEETCALIAAMVGGVYVLYRPRDGGFGLNNPRSSVGAHGLYSAESITRAISLLCVLHHFAFLFLLRLVPSCWFNFCFRNVCRIFHVLTVKCIHTLHIH